MATVETCWCEGCEGVGINEGFDPSGEAWRACDPCAEKLDLSETPPAHTQYACPACNGEGLVTVDGPYNRVTRRCYECDRTGQNGDSPFYKTPVGAGYDRANYLR